MIIDFLSLDLLFTFMDQVTGGTLSLVGFAGMFVGCIISGDSKSSISRKRLGSVVVLIGAASALLMIFQGFHLWNQGWSVEFDSDVLAKASTRARGKGGIILLIIKFLPQFLVFGYGTLLFEFRELVLDSYRLIRGRTS